MIVNEQIEVPTLAQAKDCFLLSNEVFRLGLSGGAKLIYVYLLCCEDRDIYQCVVSCKMIGHNVNMSVNAVRKYVTGLVEKSFISTENITVTNRDGQKQNGLNSIFPTLEFSI